MFHLKRLPYTAGSFPLPPVKTEDNCSFLFYPVSDFLAVPRLEESRFNSHLMYSSCVVFIIESLDLICEIKHSAPLISL